jgi:SecY interacting protein Syd
MKSTKLYTNDLNLKEAVWQFGQAYIEGYQQQHNSLPIADVDPESASPCQVALKENDKTTWQVIKINESLNFKNINSALDVEINQDIEDYFGSMYADSIPAQTSDGKLSLLFAWDHNDFQRLQENIIGHIMMKQRLKQKITLFFAVTDEEDMIISLDNESGEIWVEQVGCEPHKKLANSMQEFLSSLSLDFSEVSQI